MLSAVVERFKRLVGSSPEGDETATDGGEGDEGPDLYECEGCGAVFISKPTECSNCEEADFSNVGKFE